MRRLRRWRRRGRNRFDRPRGNDGRRPRAICRRPKGLDLPSHDARPAHRLVEPSGAERPADVGAADPSLQRLGHLQAQAVEVAAQQEAWRQAAGGRRQAAGQARRGRGHGLGRHRGALAKPRQRLAELAFLGRRSAGGATGAGYGARASRPSQARRRQIQTGLAFFPSRSNTCDANCSCARIGRSARSCARSPLRCSHPPATSPTPRLA